MHLYEFEYIINEKTNGITITKYKNSDKNISSCVIPAKIDGITVTAIGESAFSAVPI
jgi:hypothetical protein